MEKDKEFYYTFYHKVTITGKPHCLKCPFIICPFLGNRNQASLPPDNCVVKSSHAKVPYYFFFHLSFYLYYSWFLIPSQN